MGLLNTPVYFVLREVKGFCGIYIFGLNTSYTIKHELTKTGGNICMSSSLKWSVMFTWFYHLLKFEQIFTKKL